jgi:hypothetical protein
MVVMVVSLMTVPFGSVLVVVFVLLLLLVEQIEGEYLSVCGRSEFRNTDAGARIWR